MACTTDVDDCEKDLVAIKISKAGLVDEMLEELDTIQRIGQSDHLLALLHFGKVDGTQDFALVSLGDSNYNVVLMLIQFQVFEYGEETLEKYLRKRLEDRDGFEYIVTAAQQVR